MKLPGFVLVIRKMLGKLTDVLTAGRAAGLWNKGSKPDFKGKK